jgi:RimJ/RimL family protein N-acetyltransferase
MKDVAVPQLQPSQESTALAPCWASHPVVLKGAMVELRPLEVEALVALHEVAQDSGIWQATSVDYSAPDVFFPNFRAALEDRDNGKSYPFLIYLAGTSRIIGTTRLLDMDPKDRKLEIGVTWIAREFWGIGANTECKFLLLRYCFETLGANRVQFRTKAENGRSRRALEKIGATFEGIFRKDKIQPDGSARNTAFYSIISDDWPDLAVALSAHAGRSASGAPGLAIGPCLPRIPPDSPSKSRNGGRRTPARHALQFSETPPS